MTKVIGWGCLVIGVALSIYVGVYQRFSNPSLTETELFLQNWPVCVVGVFFLMIAALARISKFYTGRR